jgi:hypothetical protein
VPVTLLPSRLSFIDPSTGPAASVVDFTSHVPAASTVLDRLRRGWGNSEIRKVRLFPRGSPQRDGAMEIFAFHPVHNQAWLRRSIQVQPGGPPNYFDLHFGPRFQLEIGVCFINPGPRPTQLVPTEVWRSGVLLHAIRMPPVVAMPHAEPALFDVSWLSTPGTGTFLAGLLAARLAGLSFGRTVDLFIRSVSRLRMSLVAIMAMPGVGYITRYCGMVATIGMAMSHTGVLFPFFGTIIGWLGVALSGSDAGSNALFGSLQVLTANHLGLSPILTGAANSAGGVMGKMVAAQSLVIACAVTKQEGREGALFNAVLKHSLGLLALVGLTVLAYAYLSPTAIPGH